MKLPDLIGQRFGRLTVIKRVERDKWGHHRWLCRCDCGKEKIVLGSSLKSGHTKSCGCLRKEIILKVNTKHGHCKNRKISQIHRIWDGMIQRCTNPKNKAYKDYGGRGITVCERWLNSFPNFLEDMGERPDGLTLERRNNDKGYHKKNCYWATRKQQQRNKRNNRLIEYNGKIQCMAAWAEETGIPGSVIWKRLKRGWSIEKALTTLVRKHKRRRR